MRLLVFKIGLDDVEEAVRRTLVQYFLFHDVKDGLEGPKAIMVAEGHMKGIWVFLVVNVQLWYVGLAQISICIRHHHVSDGEITLTFNLVFLVNISDYLMTILTLPVARNSQNFLILCQLCLRLWPRFLL